MKKITIIIPCYNVERYIAKCISSVFQQDLHEDEFEVIIVDDDSPDGSLAIAREVTQNRKNITIISQENKGLGGARNTGVLNATGEYLLFLDSDDWLLPNVLKNLLIIAEQDDLDILEFSAQGINSEGKILYQISNNSTVFNSGFDYYNNIRYMNSACNKLYRRDFLRKNNILFLEQIFIEDFEFNTRCFSSVKRIRATDLVVAQFLQSENSITRNTDDSKKNKMISDIIAVIKKTHNLSTEFPTCKQTDLFFLERMNFLVATLFFQLVKRRSSYEEVKALKSQLIKEDVFYVNHQIFDVKKNIFRILLLKNLWLYPVVRFFK
ncbi:glycosyltransferase [Chryseobacterium sp. SNU WT5]|uniref:glycosyltransferase family 2 protein n=1 Tax=Chryseobacterium sp. SNU WT5 TaxID=2594269 RepID=UPI00118042AE|nr:glycosyltransferase [Chryseobacterium sp. SNU WT5]QDP85822.1 glycosyltransferase [Chryseobacterium sp. SNU WT5]